MIDIGILVTGVVATACFVFGRGKWLRHVLMIAWLVTALEAFFGVGRSFVVLTLALLDLTIAGTAVIRVTHDPSRIDARTVGGLSMALMPAHFVMSVSLGNVNWTLYAVACNLVFILQCLTAGGWLDGMGRSIAGILRRMRPVRVLRRRGH
jgi:hypothetical protein